MSWPIMQSNGNTKHLEAENNAEQSYYFHYRKIHHFIQQIRAYLEYHRRRLAVCKLSDWERNHRMVALTTPFKLKHTSVHPVFDLKPQLKNQIHHSLNEMGGQDGHTFSTLRCDFAFFLFLSLFFLAGPPLLREVDSMRKLVFPAMSFIKRTGLTYLCDKLFTLFLFVFHLFFPLRLSVQVCPLAGKKNRWRLGRTPTRVVRKTARACSGERMAEKLLRDLIFHFGFSDNDW